LDTALDSKLRGPAARCGVIRTRAVDRRTTLLLCRYRVNLTVDSRRGEHSMLAEEAALLAFAGPPDDPTWLDDAAAEVLLAAEPSGNVTPDAARDYLTEVLRAESTWRVQLDTEAHRRADEVAAAHARVRAADRRRGASTSTRVSVSPQLPV